MFVTRFEVGNISCKAFTDLFTTNYNVDARDKVGVITNYIVNDRFTRRSLRKVTIKVSYTLWYDAIRKKSSTATHRGFLAKTYTNAS